ncbi:MAG: hypothetical protein K2W95_36320 [Candidatus Obscuribacterales bacterium]|nr:hypothetical protein [Candidatus Obscuribacterales bacterium]
MKVAWFVLVLLLISQSPATSASTTEDKLIETMISESSCLSANEKLPFSDRVELAELLYLDYVQAANRCADRHAIPGDSKWLRTVLELRMEGEEICAVQRARGAITQFAGLRALAQLDSSLPRIYPFEDAQIGDFSRSKSSVAAFALPKSAIQRNVK